MKLSNLFSKLIYTQDNALFDEIIGYENIKRLFNMALNSDSAVHILLVGPPASAKTMFLTILMHHLKSSYFTDGANSTKAGMIQYLFENRPRYLLIDEIDKMPTKHQTMLLNLMGTGIVTETKYRKTRSAQIWTSVFATSNSTNNLSAPLLSRFFIVQLEPYTYEEFCEITKQLLLRLKIEEQVACTIATAIWAKTQDIRDCVKIGALANSISDVKFLADNFFGAR